MVAGLMTMTSTTALPSDNGNNNPPSEFEVDYDSNITKLYEAITNSDWNVAIEAVTDLPKEARTWVVRKYEDSTDIMWRFLPIHSACARQPPASVISALLKAYPAGARCVDDQGMYPLHYACGNQASREVIRLLLVANPQAAKVADPRGMLPIHYLACWGPSSVSVIDMVLVANRNVGSAADMDGNTALDLAKEGEYAERGAVVAAMERWFDSASTASFENVEKPVDNNPAREDSLAPTRSLDGSYSTALRTESETRDRAPTSPLTPTMPTYEVKSNKSWERSPSTSPSNKMAGSGSSKLYDDMLLSDLKTKCFDLERTVHQSNSSLTDAKSHITSLERKVSQQEHELNTKTDLLRNMERDVDKRMQSLQRDRQEVLQSVERQSERSRMEMMDRISELERERDGLRETLTEVSKDSESYKRRCAHMNDRVGSLSASLSSLIDQQSALMKNIQERDAQVVDNANARRENLQKLLDNEERITSRTRMDSVTRSMEQQAREMEAISAVIAVIRK